MKTELQKLLTSEDAVFDGIIDVEAVLNNINEESVNVRAGNGNFPIHEAAMLPNAESAFIIVKEMISKGADVNSSNDSKRTPLHLAITTVKCHSSTKVVELLLENGADPLIENEDGIRPADIATPEILKLINSYVKDKLEFSANSDAQRYILRLIGISGDQASILVHNLENCGFMFEDIELEPDGYPIHVYSDGNCKLKLKCSSQDTILGVEYVNQIGETITLK